MRSGSIFRRFVSLPKHHYFVAAGLAGAIGAGTWFLVSNLPIEYISSALLSYDSGNHLASDHQAGDADVPVVRVAEAVLTPAVLKKIAGNVHFPAGARPGPYDSNVPLETAPYGSSVQLFRSHFDLEQSAPGLLQVTFRADDSTLVSASTKALSEALVTWVAPPVAPPAPAINTPTPPVPDPADGLRAVANEKPVSDVAQMSSIQSAGAPASGPKMSPAVLHSGAASGVISQRRIAKLDDDLATLELQQRSLDRTIANLVKRKPVTGSSSASNAENSATRRVEFSKQIAELRALRASLISEEDQKKKQIADLKDEAATKPSEASDETSPPSVVSHPAENVAEGASKQPAPSQSATPGTGQTLSVVVPVSYTGDPSGFIPHGSFSVLEWGASPLPVADKQKPLLMGAGMATAAAVAIFYLMTMIWRFAPISEPAALRRALRGDAEYFGAVSGTPVNSGSSIHLTERVS